MSDFIIRKQDWSKYGIKKYGVMDTLTPYQFHIIWCHDIGSVRNTEKFTDLYECDVPDLIGVNGLTSFNKSVSEICIFLSSTDVGIIAHEALHGVLLMYCNGVTQVPVADESSELFAYALQHLIYKIVKTIGSEEICI